MVDLSRRWPLGFGERGWWRVGLAALALLALALVLDRPLSQWAQGWPGPLRAVLEQITHLGEARWVLVPSGFLFVVTMVVALFAQRRLLRVVLRHFAALYGFVFLGVGVPQLIASLAKRGIGRGRPERLDEYGLFHFEPNWLDWSAQSFPSAHAAMVFALAAVIGFLAPRWFYPALALAGVVAVSRVALGVHYPSDVAAGAMLGVLGAYLVRWVFARRGWLFREAPAGGIVLRPMSALRRYARLRRRDSAPARPAARP